MHLALAMQSYCFLAKHANTFFAKCGMLRNLVLVVLRSGDDFVLQLLCHVVKIVTIASHAHQQVTVFVGVLLGIVEGGRVDNVELDVVATEFEVGADELCQLLLVLVALQQCGHKAHVEQRATALRLVELAQRLDDSSGAVAVAAVGG